MSSEAEGGRKQKSDSDPLRISVKADTVKVDRQATDHLVDNERFLREAFRSDPWKGCTLLFEHYYMPLCSHSVRYVYSREYAEDIVADVFKEFWHKKHYKNVTSTFRTYLFRAVRNRSLNFIRKEFKKKNENLAYDAVISGALRPDEQMMYDQFYQKIQKAIDQLPPKCRKIFLMSRFEGKPLKEIAEIQKISVRTVETHVSKALAELREILKD